MSMHLGINNDDDLQRHYEKLDAENERTNEEVRKLRREGVDKTDPRYVSARAASDAAASNLADSRRYWREIGEAVPIGAPGYRDPQRPLAIANNDGSVPNYGGATPTIEDLRRDGLLDHPNFRHLVSGTDSEES